MARSSFVKPLCRVKALRRPVYLVEALKRPVYLVEAP